jgi:hypothetical protein
VVAFILVSSHLFLHNGTRILFFCRLQAIFFRSTLCVMQYVPTGSGQYEFAFRCRGGHFQKLLGNNATISLNFATRQPILQAGKWLVDGQLLQWATRIFERQRTAVDTDTAQLIEHHDDNNDDDKLLLDADSALNNEAHRLPAAAPLLLDPAAATFTVGQRQLVCSCIAVIVVDYSDHITLIMVLLLHWISSVSAITRRFGQYSDRVTQSQSNRFARTQPSWCAWQHVVDGT